MGFKSNRKNLRDMVDAMFELSYADDVEEKFGNDIVPHLRAMHCLMGHIENTKPNAKFFKTNPGKCVSDEFCDWRIPFVVYDKESRSIDGYCLIGYPSKEFDDKDSDEIMDYVKNECVEIMCNEFMDELMDVITSPYNMDVVRKWIGKVDHNRLHAMVYSTQAKKAAEGMVLSTCMVSPIMEEEHAIDDEMARNLIEFFDKVDKYFDLKRNRG